MQKKPPKRTRVLKVEGNIQEDKSKMGGWHKFLRYFVCVSADVSIPQKPERGRGGQPFSVKVSPLGSASFGRLFKNNSKAAAAECHGSQTSLECPFHIIQRGRNAVAAPAPHNTAALVRRQINGLLDPPLPLLSGAMQRA